MGSKNIRLNQHRIYVEIERGPLRRYWIYGWWNYLFRCHSCYGGFGLGEFLLGNILLEEALLTLRYVVVTVMNKRHLYIYLLNVPTHIIFGGCSMRFHVCIFRWYNSRRHWRNGWRLTVLLNLNHYLKKFLLLKYVKFEREVIWSSTVVVYEDKSWYWGFLWMHISLRRTDTHG